MSWSPGFGFLARVWVSNRTKPGYAIRDSIRRHNVSTSPPQTDPPPTHKNRHYISTPTLDGIASTRLDDITTGGGITQHLHTSSLAHSSSPHTTTTTTTGQVQPRKQQTRGHYRIAFSLYNGVQGLLGFLPGREPEAGWLFFFSLYLFSQYPTFCEGALVGRKGSRFCYFLILLLHDTLVFYGRFLQSFCILAWAWAWAWIGSERVGLVVWSGSGFGWDSGF